MKSKQASQEVHKKTCEQLILSESANLLVHFYHIRDEGGWVCQKRKQTKSVERDLLEKLKSGDNGKQGS